MKKIDAKSSGYFRFKEGTLYPALHRLEKERLVEGRWQPAPGGQDRRYYSLTPKGTSVLAASNFLASRSMLST